jgi:hypothetical protein
MAEQVCQVLNVDGTTADDALDIMDYESSLPRSRRPSQGWRPGPLAPIMRARSPLADRHRRSRSRIVFGGLGKTLQIATLLIGAASGEHFHEGSEGSVDTPEGEDGGTPSAKGHRARHGGGSKIVKRLATRATVIPALGALGLVLLAQPAWSAPKKSFCDPPAELTVVDGSEERIQLPDGTTILTGKITVTVTSTEGSATYNISGPTQFDEDTGEVTLLGPSLILVPGSRGDAGSLFYNTGRATFTVGEPIEEQVGNLTDVCADLAA